MSRVDHMILRRMCEIRPVRVKFLRAGPGRRRADVFEAADGKRYPALAAPHHRQGFKWWREHYADLVERRTSPKRKHRDATYSARPPLPEGPPQKRTWFGEPERTPGMTRQEFRRLKRTPWR